MDNIKNEKREIKTTAELVSFAFEIGYSIIIPIIILIIIGKFADDYFNTKPILMIAGVILSFFSTSIIIYHKTKRLL